MSIKGESVNTHYPVVAIKIGKEPAALSATAMLIPPDVRMGRVAEGEKDKYVFGYILKMLESKGLANIAEQRYKFSGFQNMSN
jgi:hypothetical protein